jgi:Ca-activated chloride channel family protein
MGCVSVAVVVLSAAAHSQIHLEVHHWHSRASHVVMPQSRVYSAAARASPSVKITGVTAAVEILEQAATTTMDIALSNPSGQRLEAELMVPVPDGAVVGGFTFQGAAKEPTAKLLPKDEARKIYQQIVARIKDPGLLEFAGYNLIRSSVFPIPPNGKQRIRLTYEHLLTADGDRIDYVLPRSESIAYDISWQISVRIKSKRPISTVYSPTHKLDKRRVSDNVIRARVAESFRDQPGPFQLSYLLQRNGVTASLLAYPDPKSGGGSFLLLAGLPAKLPKGRDAIRREVTLVLDRSGSMHGDKLTQVREAALQILAGLNKGEAFNVIVYNHGVDLFAPRPVVKTDETVTKARTYLETVTARGGTNIHDALVEALRQKPTPDMLPLVLFLTDGLPTVGETSEAVIRDAAMKANEYDRRVFTFGVGVDVNTPLLDKVARETRATATFVLPKQDVEVKVAGVFRRLSGPVLAEPVLELLDAEGKPALGRVRDVLPSKLPDLFEGDQLVLLGQYLGEEPITFRVKGNYLGEKRVFQFTFGFDKATTRNAFVPRLWASRRIAVLIDAIRALGADGDRGLPGPEIVKKHPKVKELVDEIIRLSTEYGILTEYTAFLAREGTELAALDEVRREALANFARRAIAARHGTASVNQEMNNSTQRTQQVLNRYNTLFDENMNHVRFTNVQQVADRTFYYRNGTWVDSRLINKRGQVKPDKELRIGSKEFMELVEKLAEEGRQGSCSMQGRILLKHNDKLYLCH